MLPLEIINAMRAFMARASLQGSEVDAYNKCMSHLHNEERLTRQAQQAQQALAAEQAQQAQQASEQEKAA